MTEPALKPDPLVGKRLRAYRIQEPIGVSRWGKVYRAFQSSMSRTVAVRVLSPQVAALPGKTEQFLEETRVEARLIHPHLVLIYEAGQAEGTYFCAMEYMDGPPLREFLRSGNEVNEHRLLQTIMGVARALDFLWRRNVQHQPPLEKNVLTATDGSVKLINFEPVEMAPSQSQQEDLLRLGLMAATLANDIAPVSRPVSRFVERMLGAAGHELFGSLAEVADAAEALDHKLSSRTEPTEPRARKIGTRRCSLLTLIIVGLLALLFGMAIGWYLCRMLSH